MPNNGAISLRSSTIDATRARFSSQARRSALDRLWVAGLLFRQGVPPHATYLFKHALVQDASYGTLLREPRRALHARIAETLERQFAEIAESQPECTMRGAPGNRGKSKRLKTTPVLG
jgi:predicted ATPase